MYHVSVNFHSGRSLYFKPRVPWESLSSENQTIRRICCSETIEGALEGIRSHHIAVRLFRKYEKKDITGLVLHVYQPFGKIEDKDILTNAQLLELNYVPDATYTKELWILKPVQMKYLTSIEISERLMLDYEDRMQSFFTADFPKGEVNWGNYYKEIVWVPQKYA